MRNSWTYIALSLALVLGACGTGTRWDAWFGSDEQEYTFRAEQIEEQRRYMEIAEGDLLDCPPGTEECSGTRQRSYNSLPALRGATPFQAQITVPEVYTDENGDAVAADDWEARHWCGGSLIAPGWVVTAAHCMHQNMVERGFRVRLGLSNLATNDGRTFVIDRLVCYDAAYCEADDRPSFPYRDDIALVHFQAAPGDVELAPDRNTLTEAAIEAVTVSPGDNSVTTWSLDGTMRRWNLRTGEELSREAWEWEGNGDRAALSAQVPTMAFARLRQRTIDVTALQRDRDIPQGEIALPASRRQLDWQPSYDFESGQTRTRLILNPTDADDRRIPASAELGELSAVRASSDQSYIVTIDDSDGYRVRSWNADTLQPRWSMASRIQPDPADDPRVTVRPNILELDADGALVGSADVALILDPQNGSVIRRFAHPRSEAWESVRSRAPEGARNLVESATFSADRSRLLTVTSRYGGSDAWLWDAATGRLLHHLPHAAANLTDQLEGASFVGGGDRVFTWTRFGTLRLWDASTGDEIATMPQGLSIDQVIVFDGERRALVNDIAGASVWDLENGDEIARIDHLQRMTGAQLSQDQTKIISWSRDGTARVWDSATGAELARSYHSGAVNGAMFVDEGAQFISWGSDGTARITDIASGKLVMAFDVAGNPQGSPLALAASERPPAPAQIAYLQIAAPEDGPAPDQVVDIYGWGKTAPVDGLVPYANLMEVRLTAMDNAECAAREDMAPVRDDETGQLVPRIHENVFCANHEERKTCKGDSGGPVITYETNVLVGIVSWGKPECGGNGEPGVYTRVSQYRDWIIAQVGEENLPAATDASRARVIGGAVR